MFLKRITEYLFHTRLERRLKQIIHWRFRFTILPEVREIIKQGIRVCFCAVLEADEEMLDRYEPLITELAHTVNPEDPMADLLLIIMNLDDSPERVEERKRAKAAMEEVETRLRKFYQELIRSNLDPVDMKPM